MNDCLILQYTFKLHHIACIAYWDYWHSLLSSIAVAEPIEILSASDHQCIHTLLYNRTTQRPMASNVINQWLINYKPSYIYYEILVILVTFTHISLNVSLL